LTDFTFCLFKDKSEAYDFEKMGKDHPVLDFTDPVYDEFEAEILKDSDGPHDGPRWPESWWQIWKYYQEDFMVNRPVLATVDAKLFKSTLEKTSLQVPSPLRANRRSGNLIESILNRPSIAVILKDPFFDAFVTDVEKKFAFTIANIICDIDKEGFVCPGVGLIKANEESWPYRIRFYNNTNQMLEYYSNP
jgi:hypothetical protein